MTCLRTLLTPGRPHRRRGWPHPGLLDGVTAVSWEHGYYTRHRTDLPYTLLPSNVLIYRQQRQQARRGLLRELTQSSQDIPGGYR